MTTDGSPAPPRPRPVRPVRLPGRYRRAILAAVAAAVLGGCEALRGVTIPAGLFAADPGRLDPSSRPIIVLPVDGLASLDQGDRFATTMAQALRDRNLAASVRGTSAGSLFLAGRAITIADADLPPGSPHFLSIDWTAVDSDGNPVAEHRQQVRVAPGRWTAADPDLLRSLSVAAADAVAIMLGDPGPKDDAVSLALHKAADTDAPVATTGNNGSGTESTGANDAAPITDAPGTDASSMTVGVLAVSGAPGSGNETLTVAMAIALTRRRLTVVDNPDDAALVIAGTVEIGPPDDGTQTVEIIWQVRRPDGAVVGRIAQANRVPVGSLDGSWRPVAPFIADSAAGGLMDLIRQATTDSTATDSTTATEPVGTEPVGGEPAGTEPVGGEPAGTEPVGGEPAGG